MTAQCYVLSALQNNPWICLKYALPITSLAFEPIQLLVVVVLIVAIVVGLAIFQKACDKATDTQQELQW